jgi:hypothetical protein
VYPEWFCKIYAWVLVKIDEVNKRHIPVLYRLREIVVLRLAGRRGTEIASVFSNTVALPAAALPTGMAPVASSRVVQVPLDSEFARPFVEQAREVLLANEMFTSVPERVARNMVGLLASLLSV